MSEELKQAAQLDTSTPTLREMVTRHALEIDPQATLEDMPEALAFQIDMARAIMREISSLTQRPAQQAGEAFESVLIDGVAYDLQAPVAAELLRLHIELQARASLPAQPAAQANAKPDLSGHDAFDVLSQGYPTHPADCRCEWCKGKPAAQATPEPLPLGPLAKRNIYDAIRGAYDLGYNDARNARTVPGDSAPGYDGRSVEEDHGSALFNILSKRLKPATPEPVGEVVAWAHGDDIYWHNAPDLNDHIRAEGRPLTYATRPAPGVPEDVLAILDACRNALMECDRDGDYALIDRIDALAAAQAKGGDHG